MSRSDKREGFMGSNGILRKDAFYKVMFIRVIVVMTIFISFSFGIVLWEPDNIKVTPEGGNRFTTYPMCRSLATKGPDTIHCVYSGWQGGVPSVYYKRSTNNGTSWGSERSFTASINSYPSIAAWDRYIYISYPLNPEAVIQRSTDAGNSWRAQTTIISPANSCLGTAIGCWGNNLYLVLHSPTLTGDSLYFYRSTNNGDYWSTPFSLGLGKYPSISVWRDTIHLVYYSSSRFAIFYRRSTNGGATWQDTIRLGTVYTDYFPSIDCRRVRVGVVWSSASTNTTVYFRGSTNSGTSWGSISYPSTTARNASVSIGAYFAHIVYQSDGSGSPELFYRNTSNNGTTWSTAEQLTNTSQPSILPYLTVFADSILKLAWTERDTVYYKKGKYLTKDVGVVSIVSPPPIIDSGSLYIPACTSFNSGLNPETYWVRLTISNIYDESTFVANHQPNTKLILPFLPFAANFPRGSYILTCSTRLNGDMYPPNDSLRRTIQVRVRDVGILEILAPPDFVNFGETHPVRVRLKNFGNVNASFYALMTIGSLYKESVLVALNPDEVRDVSFPDWLVSERGTLIVKCTTRLDGDLRPENNKLEKRTTVDVGDVGVVAILSPVGTIDSGLSVIPKVRVKNFGTLPISFPVRVSIGSFYTDYQSVENLLPEEERDVDFISCTLIQRGYHLVKCSTEFGGDQERSNDTLSATLLIRILDVGVNERLVPRDSIPKDTVFFPKARVANFGFPEVSFSVLYEIRRGTTVIYSEREDVIGLLPQEMADIEFPPLTLPDTGVYISYINAELPYDCHPENNSFSGIFRVYQGESSQPPAWRHIANIPSEPDYKMVGSGGSLTATPEGIYLIKGNNTRSLYRFSPETGEVAFVDSLPYGIKPKKVKKGAAITYGSDNLYIAKGNSTKELWQFSIPQDSWSNLPEVPGEKGLKGGTGLIYLNKHLYLLKGSKTQEFYSLNLSTMRWEILQGPPVPICDGSCLTTDGNLLYLLVGKKNLFYSYDISSNQWIERETLPFSHPQIGKKKKVKDGASLAYASGEIYATKGGNSEEVWKYRMTSCDWVPIEPVPRGPSGKRIGAGGALAFFSGKLYLMKGNKTPEIWRYDPEGISFRQKKEAERNSKENNILKAPILRPKEGVAVYNILGKLVYKGDPKELSLKPGIYFITNKGEDPQKILIVK